jgi:hypothetical protein
MWKNMLFLITFLLFGCFENHQELNKQVQAFCTNLGYTYKGHTCQDTDSDGDGYVSCTVRVQEEPIPIAIECKSMYRWGDGCRMQHLGSFRRYR